MANVRHLTCPQCGTPFTSQWPRNRKFCSRKCVLVDWRDRHRNQINEYSRMRQKTAPAVRRAINAKYRASASAKIKAEKWKQDHWEQLKARLRERYQQDPQYKAMLISRQKAHAKLKRAKHIPYICNGCGATEKLHAHHQNFNPFVNRLDNLMWLCHPCHMRVHTEARLAQLQNSQD